MSEGKFWTVILGATGLLCAVLMGAGICVGLLL
jgi:hypothetical protein